MYRPEPAALQRLRAAIAADASGKKLQTIVSALRKKGYAVATHESLASTPGGYAEDHPRIGLLKMKDIHAGKLFEPVAWLSTPKTLGRVQQVMTDLEPFNEWLKKNVGADR